MQLACVQARLCSSTTPNLASSSSLSRLRYGAGSPSVAQLMPVRRLEIDAAATTRELSSSASLFSRLSVRGGLPALAVLPKSRNGGFRVEASGAYSKEAFVSEGEASKLAQVGFLHVLYFGRVFFSKLIAIRFLGLGFCCLCGKIAMKCGN